MKNIKHQSGLTLIEIMIAMVISLILLIGVMQIYLSSKESFRIQNELGTIEENQRFAIEMLSQDIRKAGRATNKVITAFDDSITAIGDWDGDSNNNDEITISYQSDNDCNGDPTADENGIAINRYFIQNNQLSCQGNDNTQPIASDVENMQILFGEDTDPIVPGTPRTANRYVQADEADMDNVVSVRIALLLRSSANFRNEDLEQEFNLLDATKLEFDDKILRRTVTTTITLRNAT